jgi:cytochrome c oxidase assembly protein subunit 15
LESFEQAEKGEIFGGEIVSFPGRSFSTLIFAANMKIPSPERSSRPVAAWLLIGVGMLIIQVLLGGITRLTGSGLSITEWDPIMGALPPLNHAQWAEVFDKYKHIAQYKLVNNNFSLSDFKFIFFWEWFHRLWARLIGIVFIIPFFIFLYQRRFKKEMVRPMIILFLLGALQGLVGWFMVKSGLEDPARVHVSHYRLAIHFILALVLVCYTFWFALTLVIRKVSLVYDRVLKKFLVLLLVVLGIQLVYGAFMAGLKAGPYAPTWPGINGKFYAGGVLPSNGITTWFDDPLKVHFIHRSLAYLLTIMIVAWWVSALKLKGHPFFAKTRRIPFMLVIIQVLLGIATVLQSIYPSRLLWLGELHQLIAMMLLLSLLLNFYVVHREPTTL